MDSSNVSSPYIQEMKKIEKLKTELENQIKLFGDYCQIIIDSGVLLQEKFPKDLTTLLEHFSAAQNYFSTAISHISNLNCKLEGLIMEEKVAADGTRFFEYASSNEDLEKEAVSREGSDPTQPSIGNDGLVYSEVSLSTTNGEPGIEHIIESVKSVKEFNENFQVPEVRSASDEPKKTEENSRIFEEVSDGGLFGLFSEREPNNSNFSLVKVLKNPRDDPLLINLHNFGREGSVDLQFANYEKTYMQFYRVPSCIPLVRSPSLLPSHLPCLPEIGWKSETVLEEAVVDFIKPLNFERKVGSVHKAMLLRMVSPAKFYVRVQCEDLEKMEDMNQKIASYEILLEEDSNFDVREYYALAFDPEKSLWGRVKVLDRQPQSFLVFFLDYGNSMFLPSSQIRAMEPSLKHYPQFIDECYLSGICPAVGDEWSDAATTVLDLFMEAGDNGENFNIEIEEVNDDGSLGVKLYLSTSGICINDKLVEYGMAKSLVRPSYSYLAPFSVGETVCVFVTWIKRANVFFCVKDYESSGETNVLQDLIDTMNADDAESEMIMLDKEPNPGDLVIAKFEDDLWYRAMVIKTDKSSGMYNLLFVDYGNRQKATLSDMRKMEEKYLELPFQMIKCHWNVEFRDDCDHPAIIDYLYKRANEDGITIKIREILNYDPGEYRVDLFDGTGSDVAKPLASRTDVISIAPENFCDYCGN